MIRRFRFAFFTACFAACMAAAANPLEVWIMPNGANPQGILEERLAQFEKETGLKTKVVVLDWGEAWSVITRTLEGQGGREDVPAVLQLGTTWVSYFASRGELAKLDAQLKAINPKRFSKVGWNTVGTDGDSSTYSVPWFIDARALLANETILNEAGVQAKDVATYDGFYSSLKKINSLHLQRPDGAKVRAFEFPGKSDWNIPHNFAPWVWSFGGSFLKKDEKGKWRSNLLDPKTIEGIAAYLNFVLDSVVEKASLRGNTATIVQHFNSGEVAFILNTAELVAQTRFEAKDGGLAASQIKADGIAIMPVPAGKNGSVCFIGGSNLAIPKSRENDPNALKLLQFLVRNDNLDAYTRQIGFLPPVTELLKVWAKDSVYQVLIDHLENGKSYPNIPEWTLVEGALVSLFSEIWSYLDVGGLYSEEALYGTLIVYNQKINDILQAPGDTAMQLGDFLKLWKSFTHSKDTSKSSASAEPESSPSSRGMTLFLFCLAVFASFLFTYLRKRKK